MNECLNFIVGIAVLLLTGGLTAFFVVLSSHKEEFWEEIYDKDARG